MAFLDSPGGALESAPPKKFVVLLGDFNAHVENRIGTWRDVIRRNELPDLIPSGIFLLGKHHA